LLSQLDHGIGVADSLDVVANVIAQHATSPTFHEKSMFVATWSLSESPIEWREQLRELITPFAYNFIIYQHAFHGLNNIDWFHQRLIPLSRATNWKDEEMPTFQYNNWLFGYKKGPGEPLGAALDAPDEVHELPLVVGIRAVGGPASVGLWLDDQLVGVHKNEIRIVIPELKNGNHTLAVDLVVGEFNDRLGVGTSKQCHVAVESPSQDGAE